MYTFSPHLNAGPSTIAVIGCGGTGAQVARLIARMIFDMQRRNMQSIPDLLLIDPDIVEPKNIGRQLFSQAEVGEYKAVAVMRRLNAALGITCSAIPSAVEPTMLYRAKIIVGCVDNHLARRVIHEKTESQNYYGTTQVWIDAGNHRDSGQVLIGSSRKPCKPDNTGSYTDLPLPGCIFPALLEPEHAVPAVRQAHRPVPERAVPELAEGVEGAEGEPDARGLSCAELLELGEQDLLINDWMGIVAAQYVRQLLYMQPITTFLTWIAPSYLSTNSVPISPENLAAYMQRE
jgi:PRTRC genetic system ThiF family protein